MKQDKNDLIYRHHSRYSFMKKSAFALLACTLPFAVACSGTSGGSDVSDDAYVFSGTDKNNPLPENPDAYPAVEFELTRNENGEILNFESNADYQFYTDVYLKSMDSSKYSQSEEHAETFQLTNQYLASVNNMPVLTKPNEGKLSDVQLRSPFGFSVKGTSLQYHNNLLFELEYDYSKDDDIAISFMLDAGMKSADDVLIPALFVDSVECNVMKTVITDIETGETTASWSWVETSFDQGMVYLGYVGANSSLPGLIKITYK